MSAVGVTANVLYYWFADDAASDLNGTPEDAIRRLDLLGENGLLEHGAEIILFPSRLPGAGGFPSLIAKEFSAMPMRSVHIADTDPLFLLNSVHIDRELKALGRVLEQLNTEHVVLHADCLRHERATIRKLLADHLPGIRLLVENTDPIPRWGHRPTDLLEIFADIPEAGLCLDICHVGDIPDISLDDFLSRHEIRSRIGEIHFSYSACGSERNFYAERGYRGYEPLHMLWSVVGEKPSQRTRQLCAEYPVVIEGVLPCEDTAMKLLLGEIDIARGA